MRDVDSAVGRLDQILMSLWYIVAILIIISLLDVSFATIIAGAGTLVLGLSWLIGTTAQEILASCIFLFVCCLLHSPVASLIGSHRSSMPMCV